MLERAAERIEFINTSGEDTNPIFDLSKTGIAFIYTSQMKEGTSVKLELNDLVLDAKVVYNQERTDGYRMGAQFENVPAEKRKKLEEIVENFSRGVPTKCRVIDDGRKKG
jgi:hypothetical protein